MNRSEFSTTILGRRPALFALSLALVSVLTVFTEQSGWAQTYKVLHNFGAVGDGVDPDAALILDNSGNLYGTTYGGGEDNCNGVGCGTVFKLAPNPDGSWAETILHTFSGADGGSVTAPVTLDSSGNLYGTTGRFGPYGFGTAYQLKPYPDGEWTEVLLHAFKGGADGEVPYGGLTISNDGQQFYGTTQGSGAGGWGLNTGGTVFGLRAVVSTAQVLLHAFGGGSDGYDPEFCQLAFDATGNIYGTTSGAGGTVFKFTFDQQTGYWSYSVIYRFRGYPDGSSPIAGVVLDALGNVYGTTYSSGAYGYGTVFMLSPNPDGTYSENVIYDFQGNTDGAFPWNGVILGPDGGLFGTTYYGGSVGWGTIFKLTHLRDGQWTHAVLHSFGGGMDASFANALVMDSTGNLYGTTMGGGVYGDDYNGGVAFELTP